MSEVIVEINSKGETKIEVNGIQGPGCALITGRLLQELGGEVVSDDKKPEFYQPTSETEVV
jgi:hypothetical protein